MLLYACQVTARPLPTVMFCCSLSDSRFLLHLRIF